MDDATKDEIMKMHVAISKLGEGSEISFIERELSSSVHPNFLRAIFEVWLAAKHDAKPVAEFHYKKYKDDCEEWFLLDGSSIGKRFKSKVEGEEWAVANGYRLE